MNGLKIANKGVYIVLCTGRDIFGREVPKIRYEFHLILSLPVDYKSGVSSLRLQPWPVQADFDSVPNGSVAVASSSWHVSAWAPC